MKLYLMNIIGKIQKESEEELNDRISNLKIWLKNRKENNIAIIGHNSFF